MLAVRVLRSAGLIVEYSARNGEDDRAVDWIHSPSDALGRLASVRAESVSSRG